ncbi:MAG TPA: glycosyltransferase family 4 protein [Gammaproteobacteria bacterium]|nr:glycosyltransferase family 4 protein [Gammaproteobacteria bacterium]
MTINQKILLITSCYPRSEQDNSGIFLRYLATHLAREKLTKKKPEIHILAPDDAQIQPTPLDPQVVVHTFRYFPRRWQTLAYGSGILPNLRRHPARYLQLPFFILCQWFALVHLCRKLRPAILHAHWILPQGLLAVVTGSLFSIPVITTAHGGDVFALQGSLTGILKRWVLHHSTCWTANSQATASAAGKINKSPVIVPMGVDSRLFHPGIGCEPTEAVAGTPQTILFVGRLVHKKGTGCLLKAFAGLPASQRSKSRLVIVGDGLLKSTLQAQAKALGINQQVRFLGNLPNRDLPALYCAADLFVAPSIRDAQGDTEGLGVILLEAMACGTAIIASAIGGITEVIRDLENGLLVPPGKAPALTAAMERLLADPKLCRTLARNGLQLIEKHYQWSAISAQFCALYQQSLIDR